MEWLVGRNPPPRAGLQITLLRDRPAELSGDRPGSSELLIAGVLGYQGRPFMSMDPGGHSDDPS